MARNPAALARMDVGADMMPAAALPALTEVNDTVDILRIKYPHIFIGFQAVAFEHDAHGVISRCRRLGNRDDLAFQVRQSLGLRAPVNLEYKHRQTAGNVNEIRALELGVDALIADEADFFAAAEHALNRRRSRQIFQIDVDPMLGEIARLLAPPKSAP